MWRGPAPDLVRVNGGFRRYQAACRSVDAKHEEPVEPLVRDDEEPPAWLELALVRVGARLLCPVRAELALHRHDIGRRAERAVGVDGQHLDAARHVVGDGEEAPGRVGGDMTRVVAAGGPAVDEGQLAGLIVDGEGRHLVRDRLHGVEDRPTRVERKIAGVHDVRQELHACPAARLGVDAVGRQPLTASTACARGERADIGESCAGACGRARSGAGGIRRLLARRETVSGRGGNRGGRHAHELPAGKSLWRA